MREKSAVRSSESGVKGKGRVQFLKDGAPRRRFAPEGACFDSPPPEGTDPLAPGVGSEHLPSSWSKKSPR